MKWVTVWGNATSIADHKPETYAKNLTLRYPITCAFGGDKIRLHLSNFCGTEPVTLGSVTVARASSDREISGEIVQITFGGSRRVTIGAGEEIYSDEAEFSLSAHEKISVSIYLDGFNLMRSGVVITGPLSKGFYSMGDVTRSEKLPLNTTRSTQTVYFLSGVDLYAEDDCRAVVCYGDSITSQSWPDYLAKLIMDAGKPVSVVRRAASGTRVLREYTCITYESYGLMGKHRFEREISTVSGGDTVIIQQGINDIIHPVGVEVNPFRPMSDLPTVEELEEGIEYYLSLAEKYRFQAYLGTLLPIYGWRTYAPFREEMKNAFNTWVLSHENSIDFCGALQSKEDARAFAEGYDSGDHLHPSERAYQAMAQLAYDTLFEK